MERLVSYFINNYVKLPPIHEEKIWVVECGPKARTLYLLCLVWEAGYISPQMRRGIIYPIETQVCGLSESTVESLTNKIYFLN